MILDSGRLRVDERDWAFGNPLTFNDLNAAEYGGSASATTGVCTARSRHDSLHLDHEDRLAVNSSYAAIFDDVTLDVVAAAVLGRLTPLV
jgi:hypothetical protein